MIDNSKRNTLKSLALTIAATAITKAARAESAWSGNQDFLSNKPSGNSGRDAAELATVQVSTRVSAIRNELEVVITNTGDQRLTITQLTPAKVRVARGEFDFTPLLANGPLRLAAGESATVGMQRKPLAMIAGSSVPGSLTETLQKTVSIVVENSAFASVSVVGTALV